MAHCEVLPPRISALLLPLRELVEQLSIRERMPQVEVALGEDVDALVLRILDPLNEQDEALLRAFADWHRVQFFLQPKGPETVYPFYPLDAPDLNYALPDFGIVMPYRPTEFTQVNPAINRVLVRRAVGLLDPKPNERIADLFCGLGNFSLPIARRGADVVGVEGSAALVRRAQANADFNGLSARARFVEVNLFEVDATSLKKLGHFDKMLIDPPRDGAVEVIKALTEDGPRRIVYVSCSPATLARDAEVLVHAKGYVLRAAGVVNMFPHTAHVESIALFEK
jgi:23S rRNA (uracil1939-C5)-methyltransferase